MFGEKKSNQELKKNSGVLQNCIAAWLQAEKQYNPWNKYVAKVRSQL